MDVPDDGIHKALKLKESIRLKRRERSPARSRGSIEREGSRLDFSDLESEGGRRSLGKVQRNLLCGRWNERVESSFVFKCLTMEGRVLEGREIGLETG